MSIPQPPPDDPGREIPPETPEVPDTPPTPDTPPEYPETDTPPWRAPGTEEDYDAPMRMPRDNPDVETEI